MIWELLLIFFSFSCYPVLNIFLNYCQLSVFFLFFLHTHTPAEEIREDIWHRSEMSGGGCTESHQHTFNTAFLRGWGKKPLDNPFKRDTPLVWSDVSGKLSTLTCIAQAPHSKLSSLPACVSRRSDHRTTSLKDPLCIEYVRSGDGRGEDDSCWIQNHMPWTKGRMNQEVTWIKADSRPRVQVLLRQTDKREDALLLANQGKPSDRGEPNVTLAEILYAISI